ncbi:putative ribonuclease H-like domain-containing protein, partial [Tanacetum coccineum]
MITARINKFINKTGRNIDFKTKEGITFDKSKIKCFNCQKLGHFARECKFAKYQANKAIGNKERKFVPIQDSRSKAMVAQDNQGEIDWSKEFDDEPVTFAMVAQHGIGKDNWSLMVLDEEPVEFTRDGLGEYDWSEEVNYEPVTLALMAASSFSDSTISSNTDVPCCSNYSESYQLLLKNYETEKEGHQTAKLEIYGYQVTLESLEAMILTHQKNEYAWGDKYEQQEYELKMRDWKMGLFNTELEQVKKERDDLAEKLSKWNNATIIQTKILNNQKTISDKTCLGYGVEYTSSEESDNSFEDEQLLSPLSKHFIREKGYHAVPPPIGTFLPLRPDVSFAGIDEMEIRNKVIEKQKLETSESCESKNNDKSESPKVVQSDKPKIDKNKVIIEDWVDSDNEEIPLGVSEVKKKTILNSKNSAKSFENKSPKSQECFGHESRRKGLGFRKEKLCFVCYSPYHFIKDYTLHERNLSQNPRSKTMGNNGPRETRPVWNESRRVNHRNSSNTSRYPHQRRSYSPSAVLTRQGLLSTFRPNVTKAVPSQSTARTRHANSQSTVRPFYPTMDNVRPRASSFSPTRRSYNTRTTLRPNSPKPIDKSKWVKKESTAGEQAALPQKKGKNGSVVKNPTQKWRPKRAYIDHGNPEEELKDRAVVDSGCSGNMTGYKEKLSDYKDYNGGCVAFGNDLRGGRITGKGTINTPWIDFENVSYVKELKFTLLSVSQICDKKHNVLFTNTECLILSPDFMFVDENLVATDDEAILWHRRLGHVNFKNINKLVKGNLVRGLHSKKFKTDHPCLACKKGKQHKASCKKLEDKTVREPLELLHRDLFGPVSVFFLAFKDETYDILHDLILALENQLRHKNGVAERKNRTLIEATRTMLADSLLPIQFWAEAVNTACYVLNRLVYNKSTRKVQECLHVDFFEDKINEKGTKGLNNNKEEHNVDDQQFIVHGTGISEDKSGPAVTLIVVQDKSQDKKTLAKAHEDDQRLAFENEKRRVVAEKRERAKGVTSLNTARSDDVFQSTANTPFQSAASTPTGFFEAGKSSLIDVTDIPDDPNMSELEDTDDKLDDEGIFKGSSFDDDFRTRVNVWVLCDLPDGKRVIGTKWVYRIKRDEMGTVIKNKARLMDVKSAFLYGKITEEVYVKQPPSFEDLAHPNKVYKVIKALYGLHQAPRAWYERISTFLLKHSYRRGAIDKTLFIKRDRKDIMLVQVYVDDTIFGSTKQSMVKQSKAGIFINQDKYVKDILNKFDFRSLRPATTPIEAHKSLRKDEEGEDVDVHLYRSMIGCLMYLTASRPDIISLSIVICMDTNMDNHDRRSTSGGCQYLGRRLVSWQCKKQTIVATSSIEAEYVAAASCCGQ